MTFKVHQEYFEFTIKLVELLHKHCNVVNQEIRVFMAQIPENDNDLVHSMADISEHRFRDIVEDYWRDMEEMYNRSLEQIETQDQMYLMDRLFTKSKALVQATVSAYRKRNAAIRKCDALNTVD